MLILVEKVLGEDTVFNRIFIRHYYEMKKRHGYSELEIAQKREALENVLVPYKLLENREMLLPGQFSLYCGSSSSGITFAELSPSSDGQDWGSAFHCYRNRLPLVYCLLRIA